MKTAPICYRFLVAATALTVLAIQSPAGTPTRPTRRPAESSPGQPAGAKLSSDYGKLSLAFEPNMGQTDARVRFLARGGGMTTFFTDTETVMVLSRGRHAEGPERTGQKEQAAVGEVEQAVVRMKLAGSSQPRRTTGLQKLPGISNYFIGNDPAKWRTDLPHYGRIQYEGVYPGIDLLWYGNQRRLEYDFIVAPGADPKQIQVAYEGVESLRVEPGGDLVLRTSLGEMRQLRPRVYQEVGGKQVEVGARYAIVARNRVTFELATHDRNRELRIDPVVLVYSTYLGGSGPDEGYAIAVDAAGSAYVTGEAWSTDFPTQSAYQATNRSTRTEWSAFVTKFAPAGNALVYSTYLGGNVNDVGSGIAVDGAGSAYVTGYTQSTNFPTQSPYQATLAGAQNAFVTKLAPAGNALVYSTYLGGSSVDSGSGIAVDAAGSAYVMGSAGSTNFPTQSAYQATKTGVYGTFLTKLTPAGSALVYSTYLGGYGRGIAVDAAGSAYVTGYTNWTTFPTQSPYQATFHGYNDAFVTKLTPAGNALVYSTYLGGSGDDQGYGIAVDAAGSAYVTGYTSSTDFPTQSPYQATLRGTQNAFVTKLTPAGDALVYSTYLGGTGPYRFGGGDQGRGIAVDAAGFAYVAGYTNSADFPWLSGLQPPLGLGDQGAFVTKLAPAGNALAYSTYLGSNGTYGYGIAVDEAGFAYVTGQAWWLPTQSAYQAGGHGQGDAFVTKLAGPNTSLSINSTHAADFTVRQVGATYTVTVWNISSSSTSGTVTVTETIPSGLTLAWMAGTGWTCSANTCTRSDALSPGSSYPPITVTVNVAANASDVTNTVTVSGGGLQVGSSVNDVTEVHQLPVWQISKAHTGSFTQGQTGAKYTVTVSNWGNDSSRGVVTVTDTLPAGLTLVSMAGTGWTCSGNTCTRSDALQNSLYYQVITVTVNVAGSAPSPQVNLATVSGGGALASAQSSDSTTIVLSPALSIAKSHTGNFTQGQSGATYTVTVSNAGSAATSGTVTVAETVPTGMTLVSMNGGATWNCTVLPTCTTANVLAGGASYPAITVTVNVASSASSQLTNQVSVSGGGSGPASIGDLTLVEGQALRFVPVTPCRIADTRNPNGPFGGPLLGANTPRDFNIPASACGIPDNAVAYSLNMTVVPLGGLSFLSVWPAGQPQPVVSTLNSLDGRIKANAAIVPAGLNGAITAFAFNPTHVIIDINGYFIPAVGEQNLAFYPVPPCRVADTRNAAGPFGGPALAPSVARNIPVRSSSCGIPATAQAYALNLTVVPAGILNFLSTWPAGLPQPLVSTLNDITGTIVANAAIVPAGAVDGSIMAFATDRTDLIVDINGYFAPPGAAGSLDFYTATPCRILDTRNPVGPLSGPIMGAAESRSFPVPSSTCDIPSTAKAYSTNATVVPTGSLSFLTLWGSGAQPLVSTLNSLDGTIVSNAALVPAGISGEVTAYTTDLSHLILDINGYFQ
jgi:uncharacterized repeat protein (TIGR01451 family)